MNSLQSNGLTLHQYLTKKGLTPRQIDVATISLTRKKCSEMAATLFVAQKTIKFHLTAIYAALGVKSRIELLLHLKDFVVSEYPEISLQDDVPRIVEIMVQREDLSLLLPDLPRGNYNEQSSRASAS